MNSNLFEIFSTEKCKNFKEVPIYFNFFNKISKEEKILNICKL